MGSASDTVKSIADVAVLLPTVTVIGPVVAPVGTVVTICEALEPVTTAAVPLNLTMLLAGVVLKYVPLMVTCAPGPACVGEKESIVGSVSGNHSMLLPHPASMRTATIDNIHFITSPR